MAIDTLSSINSFIKAVEAGSIAAGARQLGISPAAASQNIARLEAHLGTRLLTRTTRTLALTESGTLYYEQVRHVVRDLEQAQTSVSELQGQPQGRLRIASSAAFGRHVLAPLVPGFTARYPKVSLELVLTDRSVDHIKEDIDVSIRFKQQLEPGLVARRIATVPMVFCASPAYLAKHGTPTCPEDLAAHACLMFRLPVDGRLLGWGFVRDGLRFEAQVQPAIISNDIDALAQLALAGAGIARLGAFLATPLVRAGKLQALLTTPGPRQRPHIAQADGEPLDFHVCFQDRHAVTAKVRALVDYLVEAMPSAF